MGQKLKLYDEPELYSNKFWVKLCKKSGDVVSTNEKINKFNLMNFERKYIFDIFSQDSFISKDELSRLINSVSKIPEEVMFKDGMIVDKLYFDSLVRNIGLESLDDKIEIMYGITVRRSQVRKFPTEDRIYRNPADYSMDRFMETAIYACEPCSVYCTSSDKKWYFIRCYFYYGWVKANDIALGSKNEIEDYVKSEDFIIVTGKRLYMDYNPVITEINGLSYDMGVKIPINKNWDNDILVGGMYVEGHYIAVLPLRDDNGRVKFVNALIPYNDEVNLGYMKCTRTNIISQGFKFQGERYGWGGEFEARDCSALIMDVFRCFGILLPRNSGDQLNKCMGRTVIFNSDAQGDIKLRLLSKAKAGELVYLKGHVALFIGEYNGRYYILHDTVGVHIKESAEGPKKYIPINGVTISDIEDIYTSTGIPYINAIIGLKNLFQ